MSLQGGSSDTLLLRLFLGCELRCLVQYVEVRAFGPPRSTTIPPLLNRPRPGRAPTVRIAVTPYYAAFVLHGGEEGCPLFVNTRVTYEPAAGKIVREPAPQHEDGEAEGQHHGPGAE